jgi:hypothetical protein
MVGLMGDTPSLTQPTKGAPIEFIFRIYLRKYSFGELWVCVVHMTDDFAV